MTDISSIGLAINPNNRPVFLIDWELTKFCNLDCEYCPSGPDGFHDPNGKHPSLAECLDTIDFMYKYVDLYMKHKKPNQRIAILNVYGGESLLHPNIVEILQAVKDKHKEYSERWSLTVTCTTNAIIGDNRMDQVIPLVDEFTCSFHPVALPKQQEQYYKIVKKIHDAGTRLKCIIMMHPNIWESSIDAINFCKNNGIKYLPKLIDDQSDRWAYTAEQINFTKNYWVDSTSLKEKKIISVAVESIADKDKSVAVLASGRACCGGRALSLNNNLKSSVGFVPKQNFNNWYCSVNWFFVYIEQSTGKIFTNKDCRTSLNSVVEPIGYVTDTASILNDLEEKFNSNNMPVIKCVKTVCMCGLCAPKAESKDDFKELVFRHVENNIFKDI